MMPLCRRLIAVGLFILLPTVLLAADAPATKATPPDDHAQRMQKSQQIFKDSVRRILVTRCLKCHGGESTKADFDLSTRKLLLDSGMVDLDDAAASHVMALVRHEEEPAMPFKEDRLSDQEIAQLAEWIALGAAYDGPLVEASDQVDGPKAISDGQRDFWSFRPLSVTAPPTVGKADASWVQNPIDQFIFRSLQERGLHPNPRADRRTLIRRAYFDLTGLPPTSEAIESFLQDPDPDAYEKLIDTLLASQHYGERWARHWMDVARFAESFGYEQDYNRPNAYHYRDFLIRALNDDLPYDQFVQWQLAGDELERGNHQALMATGFLGAGVFPTQLTEMEFESARYDELDDMVSTMGVAFLGLSVGCARCHDHKFDPISTSDYYRMAAAFTKTIRSEVELDLQPEENERLRIEHARQMAEAEKKLTQFETVEAAARFKQWLPSEAAAAPRSDWVALTQTETKSSGGTTWSAQPDGATLASGKSPGKETITVVGQAPLDTLAAIRLEALAHPTLPKQGPGRASNGNFVLSEIKVATTTGDPKDAKTLTWHKLAAARATHQQDDASLSVAASLQGDADKGWAVDRGGIGKDQAAVFDLAEPIAIAPGTKLVVQLRFEHPNAQHTLGHFRLSAAQQAQRAPVVGPAGPGATVLAAIEQARQTSDLKSPSWKTAFAWFLGRQPEHAPLRNTRDKLRADGPPRKLNKVQVTSEGLPHMPHHADGRGFPHFYPETHHLDRGDVHQKKEVAQPGYLRVLLRNGKDESHWKQEVPEGWTRSKFDRAALAHWITDPVDGSGHLAARVAVNRLWHHHFGRGIVSTPNDFGFPGERPTHPELLDWLAADLIHHGWHQKRMHKLIMTSAAYMQDTTFDEARSKIDRENNYLWRRTPRRLEGEAVRDALLAVSGQLDPTMYGPGTLDRKMKRRSVYFLIKRSSLIPTMMLFDWPEHLVSIGRRATTTTAPQALAFMNSPQGRGYAESLADRLPMATPKAAVAQAYAEALGRPPSPEETALAVGFVEQQRQLYSSDTAARTALADFCQALLSMNDFIYVQ